MCTMQLTNTEQMSLILDFNSLKYVFQYLGNQSLYICLLLWGDLKLKVLSVRFYWYVRYTYDKRISINIIWRLLWQLQE